MKYLSIYEEYAKEKQTLSGVAIIVEDKILLVHPQKYKFSKYMWSLPKGHVEGSSKFKSALKELEEETGITLKGKKPDTSFKYKYKKNRIRKDLKVYVYYLKKSDIKKHLKNGWDIKRRFDKKEIWQAKFFDLSKAPKKIEANQKGLLKQFKVKQL
jgi:8-oxo-dGTP pyrophosphatase MutT (NUDIX family)